MVQRCKFSIELKNFPPDLSGEPKGRIGLNAGKVWHALNEVNEISTQELSRKLSLSIEDLALAIGWLARENNIYITRKNGLLYVSNGIKSNMYY